MDAPQVQAWPVSHYTEAIRDAYYKLAKACHPDQGGSAAEFRALAAAYGCATMRRADEAPKENPCCGGKYKEAQA